MKSNSNPSRRGFLKVAGVSAAASLASLGGSLAPAPASAESSSAKPERALKLGLASYTLRKFNLDETLAITRRVGLEVICLKSFHLPMDATADEIAAAVAKVKEAGILLYGGGVIGMKSDEQVQ
ncbi:MAG: sugar phosphate isomerase/epimerase, partial [Planctomycetes bacterium]|nr:sugar phosphate isomerase/epimerase [Planctomycetota bacterium]